MYFSGIPFATEGYGDFLPAPHARLLAWTAGAVGAFTLGWFVVVLANCLWLSAGLWGHHAPAPDGPDLGAAHSCRVRGQARGCGWRDEGPGEVLYEAILPQA